MLTVVWMMLITHVYSSCVDPWRIHFRKTPVTTYRVIENMRTTMKNYFSNPENIKYEDPNIIGKMDNALKACTSDENNCKLHTIYDLQKKTITLCFGNAFCIKIQCHCPPLKKRRAIERHVYIDNEQNTRNNMGQLKLGEGHISCDGNYSSIMQSITFQNTRKRVPTKPTTIQVQIPDHPIQNSTLQQSQAADCKPKPNNSILEGLFEAESRWYLIGMFFTGLIIGSIISACLTCVVMKRSSKRKISKAVANKLYSMEMGNFNETVEQNPNIYAYAEIKDTCRDKRNCSQRNCLNIKTDDTYMEPVPKKDAACVSRSVYHQVNCIDTSDTRKDKNIKPSQEGQLMNNKYSKTNATFNGTSCETKNLLDQEPYVYNHLESNYSSPQTLEKDGSEFAKPIADISSNVYGRLKPIVDPDVTEEGAIDTKNTYMELEVQTPIAVTSEQHLSCATYYTITADSGINCVVDKENFMHSHQIPCEEPVMSATLLENQANNYNLLDKDVDSCIQEPEKIGCDDMHEGACKRLKMEPFTGYHEEDNEAPAQHYTLCNDMLHCSKDVLNQSDPTFNQPIESHETENAYFLLEKV